MDQNTIGMKGGFYFTKYFGLFISTITFLGAFLLLPYSAYIILPLLFGPLYFYRTQILKIVDNEVFYLAWFSWKKINLNEVKIYFELGPRWFGYFAIVRIGDGIFPFSIWFWWTEIFSDVNFFKALKELLRQNQTVEQL